MQKDLKEKILGIEPSRQVPVDIEQLVSLPEGQPHLFEETFPHSEVPQFRFDGPVTEIIDGRPVTFDFAQRAQAPLCITDTTFRDGQQARPPYTRRQVVDIYSLLGRLSGPNKVISATEFFVYSDSDIEALEACLEASNTPDTLNEKECEAVLREYIHGIPKGLSSKEFTQTYGISRPSHNKHLKSALPKLGRCLGYPLGE